ncbi:unnamed protein product [Prunus armeniaca]
MIRNRPPAFGHQPSAIGTFHHSARAMSSHPPNDSESAISLRHQPSAISTFHHSARAMSSHPPNDSESAISLRPSTFGHSAISLRPSPSALCHHTTWKKTKVLLGQCIENCKSSTKEYLLARELGGLLFIPYLTKQLEATLGKAKSPTLEYYKK